MSSATPSPSAVLKVVDTLEPPGTPLTTGEVAAEFDCTARTIYHKLETLVEEGTLAAKKVSGDERVWWRPLDSIAVETAVSRSGTGGSETQTRFDAGPRPTQNPLELPNGEGLYHEIFNQIFQFIGVLEPDGTLLEANEAALSFGGLNREDVIGKPFWDAPWWQISDQTQEQLKRAIDRAADGEFVRYEVEVQGADRTAIIDFSLRPVTDEQGNVTYLLPEGRDISDLKQRERQLRQERDLLDQMLNTSPVGIAILNRDGEFTRLNDRAFELLGISETEAGSYTPADRTVYNTEGELVSVEDHPFYRAIETGESVFDWEAKVELQDGGYRWLSVNAAPICDETGEVTRVVTTGEDITQLKEQAHALERQRDEFESELAEIFERISDGFIALDENFRFTYLNDHAETLLELDGRAVTGQDIRETLPVPAAFKTAVQTALESQEPVFQEVYYDPLDTWFENAIYPSETGVSVYFRDISDRKQRERQLEESERRYQTLVENFPNGAVALVDHDLRYITFGGTLEGSHEIPRADIEGELLGDVLPEEIADVVVPRYREALDGTRSEFEETIENEVYRFHFVPVCDEDGEVFAAMGMSQNISDRKHREQQLEKYKTIVETVTDGIVVVDNDSQIRAVNEALVEMTGHSRQSLVGAPASLIRPDDLSPVMDGVQSSLDAGTKTEVVETMIQPADDDPIPTVTNFARITLADGTAGRVGVVRDISDQLERERQLEEAERRYRTLVEHSPDMIDILDPEGTLLDVNQRLCTELGYTEAELVGKKIWEFDQSINADDVRELLSELSVDDPRTFDARYKRSDGSTFPVEVSLVRLDIEGKDRFMAISRDISEQRQREQALSDRVHQQEIVAELGEQALAGDDLDSLMSKATELVADALDNDYCKVLELNAEAEELLLRQGVGWDEGIVGSATVSSVEDESQAAYTLSSQHPVRVEDLDTETRFSGPALLTDHDVRSGISTIIGPYENPWGILGTHDTEPMEISEYDVNFVQSVATILAIAINRHEHEQILHHQREQLAELNSINEVVGEITEAVINQSTREEIEAIVCNRLAGAASYEHAWIGELDLQSQTVRLRTEAGVEGYLDDVRLSAAPDDPHGQGPAGEAIRTGETQVIHDALANPDLEQWHDHIERFGFRSIAVVPISYEGTLYGILAVYADRPNAFDGKVCDVFTRLGEVVGHSIAATERKQALMSPELTQIQYLVPDFLDALGISSDTDGTIQFDRAVPIGDDRFLEYGTVDEAAVETLQAIADHHPAAGELTIPEQAVDDRLQFQLRVSEPPIISTVASHGGSLQHTRIEDGDLYMTIHLPTTVAARRIIDVVRDTYPTATLQTRRQITRDEDAFSQVHHTYTEELTERQRSALEAAVYSGFFEWPRNTSGEELADSLGVSPPTFHQHLRLAQKKVFESLLVDSPA